jgi:hypothetical protein
MDRREAVKLAAAAAIAPALPWKGIPYPYAGEAPFSVADPRYDALYRDYASYYVNDPQWMDWTRPRLTWPKAGERVPELNVMIANIQSTWLDAWRKWAADGEKLGLTYNIQQVSQARWLDAIISHKHGDIEVHSSILRPERVDPSEWLVSRAYGLDRRNYGEWVNKDYDALIDSQARESDPEKRRISTSPNSAGAPRSSKPITARPGTAWCRRAASASARSTPSTLSSTRSRRPSASAWWSAISPCWRTRTLSPPATICVPSAR